MVKWYTDNLEDFYVDDSGDLQRILSENALALFPMLRRQTASMIGGSTVKARL